MGYRVTGIGAFGVSLNWEQADGDKQIARNVVTFMEDRRILFADFQGENEVFCVRAANTAREFLTQQLMHAKPGESLVASLKAMRAAFRHFVDLGGDEGRDFGRFRATRDIDPLSLALGELRAQVGLHILLLAYFYGLEVEDELAAILPKLTHDDELESATSQLP